MPRQKREKSGTGICHVMQGKESKTCPYDSFIVGVLGGVLGSWGASSLAEYGMDKYYQK